MPFRNYMQFDGETLDKMSAAYDAVMARLGIKSDDPRTSKLASLIAGLASEGVRDVATLAEKAVAGLEQKRRRKS